MTQAVNDGATVKIYYEARLAKIKLNEEVLHKINQEYWNMQVHEDVEDYVVESSQKQLSRMEQIISNSDRVRELVTDLIAHYEERENLVKGKAMDCCLFKKFCL